MNLGERLVGTGGRVGNERLLEVEAKVILRCMESEISSLGKVADVQARLGGAMSLCNQVQAAVARADGGQMFGRGIHALEAEGAPGSHDTI